MTAETVYYAWAGFFTAVSILAVVIAFTMGGKGIEGDSQKRFFTRTIGGMMFLILLGSILAYSVPVEVDASLTERSIIFRFPLLVALMVGIRGMTKVRNSG